MSEGITATLGGGENFPAMLDCIMKVCYARVFSTKDSEIRQNLAESYNFKARVMNEQFGLSLQYIAVQSN